MDKEQFKNICMPAGHKAAGQTLHEEVEAG